MQWIYGSGSFEDEYKWIQNHSEDYYYFPEMSEANQYFDNGLPLESNLIATPDDWLDTALWIKSL